jgi:hypothetical protein
MVSTKSSSKASRPAKAGKGSAVTKPSKADAISAVKTSAAKNTAKPVPAPASAMAGKASAKVKPQAKPQAKPSPAAEPSVSPAAQATKSAMADALGEAVVSQAPKAETALQRNLSQRPAASLQAPLRIFQIYYEGWQRELLDPNFIALDNGKTSSELMEFAVFERLAKSDYVKGAQLWGALSWRFTERTGMSGADWVKAIHDHPGADVYFCDPVPYNEALFHNFWMQGETAHPQFFALCQAVFKAAGLPEEDLTAISPSDQFSASNYFVATPRFWQGYLTWINQVLSAANKKLPPNIRDMMHSKMADDRDLHKGATYVPFIVERLFPVFMKTAGKGLKGFKIPLPERERELNVHLKLLREMKDVAHRTKSAWLAACWVNYRNLYLTQTKGKEWCTKYLRTITPTEIKFSE